MHLLLDILLGLVVLLVILAIVYVHRHPGVAAQPLTLNAVAKIVGDQIAAVPALVDARVQALEASLAEALARAKAAEDAKAASDLQHAALIAGVKDRVTAAVTAAPELEPAPPEPPQNPGAAA